MFSTKLIGIVLLGISLSVLTGCGGVGIGAPGANNPETNELAKQTLPGTWQGPAGTSITFDTNGNITDINLDNVLPDNLKGIKFDGSEFDLPIPGTNLTVTATLTLQKAIVNDDGSVEIVYKGQATGGLAGLLGSITGAYVTINVNGQLDDLNNPAELTGTISGTAHVLGQDYQIGQSAAPFIVVKG